MSQQGPILVVSNEVRPSFLPSLDAAKLFPLIEVAFADAARAVAQLQPAAILAAMAGAGDPHLEPLAKQSASAKPYLPLIAVDPKVSLPSNAIPFMSADGNFDRLVARLHAALRIRALHATVLRRLGDPRSVQEILPDGDPIRDATVLLVGRGGAFPALSVAFGERIGVVGAFSIEAAANHLNTRDIDGILLGEGFTARVEDAFLTVLSEDARFRNLPVVVTSGQLAPAYGLANLEMISGQPADVAAYALPLIRQRAFEARLSRALRSIEAGGMLDPQTGLLTKSAFDRDFAVAVKQAKSHGGGLSIARFAFPVTNPRAHLDGGRILSRLMRKMDFGTVHDAHSVVVVFADTDLRSAHAIARRLASVMRQTSYGKRAGRSETSVNVAALQSTDTVKSLLDRLYDNTERAAS
ncbi:GGDEF domain-containing protein [Bradyrhizobium sp.]|uniref:GGDEF domain-containing protein n=1 Tax=Bradyrhizobium sp. TaxID=376 RepID=UPI003C414A51